MSNDEDVQGGEERWYVVDKLRNDVHYGPAPEKECQQIAAKVESDIDEEVDFSIIDRNGLIGFERAGGVEWTYREHATHPSEVDGGLIGELLDAAFADSKEQ